MAGSSQEIYIGKQLTIGRVTVVYWGITNEDAHRWRKGDNYMDLGEWSIMGLRPFEVRLLGILFKPMRWWWHRRFRQCKLGKPPAGHP